MVCLVCGLAPYRCAAEPEPPEPPKAAMPEFSLLDLGITTRWEANKSGIITRVTVTEVLKRSSAWTSGLREGDALLAVNHRQVVGMHRDDYLAALEVPLTPANPRIFTFGMSRGFGIVFTSTFDLMVELKPKQSPPPNPPRSPTPPARADSISTTP
jgi:PDZ domain